MAICFRSIRSVRCVTTLAMLFFLGGCVLAILKLNRFEDPKDGQFLQIKLTHDRDRLATQLLKDHVNKEWIHARNTSRGGTFKGLKGLKREINHTFDTTDKLKQDISKVAATTEDSLPNYNVHAFYYLWYGNPEHDGKYLHWNHDQLPHWKPEVAKRWPQGQHKPTDDIGANFYPELGCYSSRDPVVVDHHMQQFREAGIGVLVLSWYPPNKADTQGQPSDDIVPLILDMANKYKLKVAFHSEPYEERTEKSFIYDFKYIVNSYGSHPAFYRYKHLGQDLPLIYVYDSYLTHAKKWATVLKGDNSIRHSKYNALFIGLLVKQSDKADIVRAGFDGFYTYFASNVFTFGSKWQNWKTFARTALKEKLIFIPSVGPGYTDVSIRPWNGENTRKRNHGRYYNLGFEAALNVKPKLISITSFNEWHEGTQIERAVPKKWGNFTYNDYRPNNPDYYLKLTRQWTDKFGKMGIKMEQKRNGNG